MKLIDVDKISEIIRKSRRTTLERYVKQSGFPRPMVSGRPALWDESEVLNFIRNNRRTA